MADDLDLAMNIVGPVMQQQNRQTAYRAIFRVVGAHPRLPLSNRIHIRILVAGIRCGRG
jgi:hypothetical protein